MHKVDLYSKDDSGVTIKFPDSKEFYPFKKLDHFETELYSPDIRYLENFITTGRFHDKYYTVFENGDEIFDDFTWKTIESPDYNLVEVIDYRVAEELSYLVGIFFGYINVRGLPLSYWFAFLYDTYWRDNPFDLERPKGIEVGKESLENLTRTINPSCLLITETPETETLIKGENLIAAGGHVLHCLVGCGYGDVDLFVTGDKTRLDASEPLTVDSVMFVKLFDWIREEVRTVKREDAELLLYTRIDEEHEEIDPHEPVDRSEELYVQVGDEDFDLENPYLCFAAASKNSLSYIARYEGAREVEFQLIRRLYKTPLDVILDFDIDSVRCYYDGEGFYSTLTFIWSIVHACNVVNPQFYTAGFNQRLVKYKKRGFELFAPELSRRPSENFTGGSPKVRELRHLMAGKLVMKDSIVDYGEVYRDVKEIMFGEDPDLAMKFRIGDDGEVLKIVYPTWITPTWSLYQFFDKGGSFFTRDLYIVYEISFKEDAIDVEVREERTVFRRRTRQNAEELVRETKRIISDGIHLFFTPFVTEYMLDESERFQREIVNYWEN